MKHRATYTTIALTLLALCACEVELAQRTFACEDDDDCLETQRCARDEARMLGVCVVRSDEADLTEDLGDADVDDEDIHDDGGDDLVEDTQDSVDAPDDDLADAFDVHDLTDAFDLDDVDVDDFDATFCMVDSIQNGDETDTDCGGFDCPPCQAGQSCEGDFDCLSLKCVNGVCEASAECDDGLLNGDETDLDCGGSCAPCGPGQTCQVPQDCSTAFCDVFGSGTCEFPVNCATLRDVGLTQSGIYQIDPDGTGSEPPFAVFCELLAAGGGWTRCLELVNTGAEDLTNNDWLTDCITWSLEPWTNADLLLQLRDGNGSIVFEDVGMRTVNWTPQLGTCTDPVGCSDPGAHGVLANHTPIDLGAGHLLYIVGQDANNTGCAGSVANGYGVAVVPFSPMPVLSQPFLLALPYRHQVGANTPRLIEGWGLDSEISWDGTVNVWSTCDASQPPPPFLGALDIYVR